MQISTPTDSLHSVLHCLPPDDPQRTALHNEVHARPSARIRLPALIVYVAVLNEGVSREAECAHLNRLPGQAELSPERLQDNFLRLRLDGITIKWERHSEFTRYSIVQPLPAEALLGACEPDLLRNLAVSPQWLAQIPGRTVAAVQLAMLHAPLDDATALMAQAVKWLGGRTVVASLLGSNAASLGGQGAESANRQGYEHPMGHSWALTQFRLQPDGFERMLVIAPEGTSQTRAGRIAARLLELETYRLMALRGLPVGKALGPMLAQAEGELVRITAQLENKSASDQELLDTLVSLAAGVERATAANSYRFAATQAYYALVNQRIRELREKAIPGTQTLGEFMQRRLSPAMATVVATEQRLASLSERVARASGLLRTRVDIATEVQNQQLLEKLTRGQELQLRLQSTVEGLSIAAISYYVISLLLYGGKALKAAGLPINPEMASGALVPVVLWAVWRTTRRIHAKLQTGH
ncbi:DUF3422 family protein [Rhodoferax sp.]|uniref:DUF3422 family protein n=1 Tax=Rhodoferax sp. TaxID=50421 RepID=UPI00272FE9C8|nr:DUF3422 domain-containing protein [Rhodoferax sp.]MDP1531638.1 DUF3422 domain-containing protein [Rhodoferax sp.]MDP1944195.1 DUF3422 domain-containing protein [Rhodoferax sp.]MDP2441151.1 DUF3422 domain-containing protein [Rhodoferax sp.]MDZ4209477.1 DUF3422 domain-containing protein [Rhodoferax sp.]